MHVLASGRGVVEGNLPSGIIKHGEDTAVAGDISEERVCKGCLAWHKVPYPFPRPAALNPVPWV